MATSSILTLSQLRTAAKQRADLENSNFIGTSEWNYYINGSLKELYDLQLQKYGNDYFATYVEFVTDGSSINYALPNGTNFSGADPFYKLLGVDLELGNTPDSWVTIPRFNFSDRNRYAVPNFQSFYGITNMRYRLYANRLWLTPTASAGQNMRIWYVPRKLDLTTDADTTDCYGGWDEYVVLDAAIKAKIKQELDYSQLQAKKDEMRTRIESVAENRDAGNPPTVADTLYQNMWWPTPNGSPVGGGCS